VGKLAERLSDPARSGVYRVETSEAVEEAAGLNGYPLVRVALDGSVAGALQAAGGAGDRVVLVTGFERFFEERPDEGREFLSRLGAAAQARRGAGERFFVAFLDPRCVLPALAPLYNWAKKR
jgi:hypothetical protein